MQASGHGDIIRFNRELEEPALIIIPHTKISYLIQQWYKKVTRSDEQATQKIAIALHSHFGLIQQNKF